jgi:hypothetical protein
VCQIPTIVLADPLPLKWALGGSWGTELRDSNQHFAQASLVTSVTLDIPVANATGDTVAVVKITGGVEAAYEAHGY